MRRRKEHNTYCESFGVNPIICDETNKWMDAPAKHGGGCSHREKRHSSSDCMMLALKAKTFIEGFDRYFACQIHREADRRTDKCGLGSLSNSNQGIIPLLDARRFPLLRLTQELIRTNREQRLGLIPDFIT